MDITWMALKAGQQMMNPSCNRKRRLGMCPENYLQSIETFCGVKWLNRSGGGMLKNFGDITVSALFQILLTFGALALCQSDWRNCGLCVGLYAESGATLLVGVWWRENKNKLVEWKALVDTVPNWKINFCSSVVRLSELTRCKERPQNA